jgi:putative transcription factor
MIDDVRMMLCQDCIRHGEGVEEITQTTSNVHRGIIQRTKKSSRRDIYEKMKKELVSNYSDVIKEARKKKGLSREDLGFKIGERTVTIAKIENGDLRPSDKMVEKLEKELEIQLMEEVKSISSSHGRVSSGLTLGDFIKSEK